MKYITKELPERYFIGLVGKFTPSKDVNMIPQLWNKLMNEDFELLKDVEKESKFIGLEAYPHDFMETHEFYYHALVQTKEKVEVEGFETIVLQKGTYIFFEISFDTIKEDIPAIYSFIKENNININYAFDYEDYLEDQDYSKKGQKLNFAFLLSE